MARTKVCMGVDEKAHAMDADSISQGWHEINAVKHAYCWSYDSGDLDSLISLFTDDAMCDFGSVGSWRGREAIRIAYAEQMRASGVPGTRMHAITNPRIEVTGDQARGRWYLIDLHPAPGTWDPVRILGFYDDDFRRVDGTWRISRSSFVFHWVHPGTGHAGQVPSDDSLGTLLAERHIQRVISNYGAAIDDRDWPALRECFTETCVVDYAASGECLGQEAVVSACRAAVRDVDTTQHLTTSPRITVTGDRAESVTPFVAQHVRGEGRFVVAGTYIDRWIKTHNDWRIDSRKLLRSWTSGDAAVMGHLADEP
ncbi:MAG: nuclear transport factor 2 family protein [Nostocoides sp.]